MKKKKDAIIVEGEVIENLPNTLFRIQLDKKNEDNEEIIILGYLAGRMRRNYIKILPGDRVVVELTPYDLERGRIVYRK